jgi:superfamily II DNA or RNA helicase
MTIYLRDNAWFRAEGVIKLGIASSPKDRENGGYVTGEVIRGEYIMILEIPRDRMRLIENLLHHEFKDFHDYRGGGTEFYKRCIIDRIEPLLDSLGIEYKRLTKAEIETLHRCEHIPKKVKEKVKAIIKSTDFPAFIQRLKQAKPATLQPSAHQQEVLNRIQEYYSRNNIGKIIWACGLGKALLSILIVKKLGATKILFGVPSIHLQKQITEEIVRVFPNAQITYTGGGGSQSVRLQSERSEQLRCNSGVHCMQGNPEFVVTTYHSCHLLLDTKFDFKIGDEAHHLVGIDKEGFRQFHKIHANKTLFMTATEKLADDGYSMDDQTVFGHTIDTKSVRWAIENKRITDYNILVLKNTEEQIDTIIRKFGTAGCNKDLFVSAYMCLKSFEKYKSLSHMLLYTNTTEDAELAKQYISQILDTGILPIRKEDVYNNALYSNPKIDTVCELAAFKSKPFGIISCVFLFGEGFNEPKLNGVCISCNMQSEIRIVQYLLRPNRIDRDNPQKIAFVVIPYIDYDDWENENRSYQKVRTIVSQLRNVDKNVEQKICQGILGQSETEPKPNGGGNVGSQIDNNILYEGDPEELKLRLRYSKTLDSKLSEFQDEFNYIRAVNKSLGLKSKMEYSKSRNPIHDPEKYFLSKGVWTNWYDFLGVDTSGFIQYKPEWKQFCIEKSVRSVEDYFELCNLYDVLPREPGDFYKDFSNLPTELGFYNLRRL